MGAHVKQYRDRDRDRSPFVRQMHVVPGEGPVPARIMLIGERPGEKEAIAGRPFVGPAGEMLNTLLAAADLDRSEIYITNLVKTFAEYAKPTRAETEEWGPALEQEIADVRPEIIGCLGTYAVEWLLGLERAEMEKRHGVPIPYCNGFHTCTVLPIYHPAAALYSPETMNAVLDDFLRLAALAAGEITVRDDQHAGREDYQRTDRTTIVSPVAAIDTEGDRTKPWCMTYSQVPGWARLSKVGMQISDVTKVYLHSALHDLGVLRALGTHLEEGHYIDTMVLAYNLCVEPQGLKALAYRHCGMEMHDYSELIEEPNRTKALDYLLKVAEREWPKPEPYIVLDKGVPKAKKPHGINRLVDSALRDLAADKRDKNGDPVDLRKRWHNWDDTIKGPVVEVLGPMPSATLDDVDPDRAEWYANRDADATLRIGPILEQKCLDMGLQEIVAIDHGILPMVDRMQEIGIQLAPTEFWDGLEAQCENQMGRAKYEIYKMVGAEINPASGNQVAELLYDQMGLTPPKMTDSGERGSVNAVALESLLSQAPVVQPIMDYNEANKIRGTYVEPLRKLYQTEPDHRAHSTCRVTRTTTGRLSMADPPLHQIPIMTDLGKACRGGFVVPDGYVFGDWDLDQVEMRLCAHESRDPVLCQFFDQGKDIHAETASLIFGVPVNQIEKGDVRRSAAKRTGFGIINGITEHGLLNQMILNRAVRPDGQPWTLDDCVQLLGSWFGVYKGVKKFQNARIEETRATGLARESIGGKIVYLPAIWSPIKYVRETAERMSYVMYTQGGAASLIKRCMAQVWKYVCKDPALDTEPLFWVHDELGLQVPDDECTKSVVDDLMTDILCNTVKLRVPVRASGGFGMSWLEAH